MKISIKETEIYRKELKPFLLSLLEAVAGYVLFSFFISLTVMKVTFLEALCHPAAPVFAYIVFVYYYFIRRRRCRAA